MSSYPYFFARFRGELHSSSGPRTGVVLIVVELEIFPDEPAHCRRAEKMDLARKKGGEIRTAGLNWVQLADCQQGGNDFSFADGRILIALKRRWPYASKLISHTLLNMAHPQGKSRPPWEKTRNLLRRESVVRCIFLVP
jgi:hypothetical protein